MGQLNGELTVETKQEVGTTFTVLLPQWVDDAATEEDEEVADVKALVGS